MYNFLLCLISSSPSGFIAYSLARPDMLMLAIALFISPVVSTESVARAIHVFVVL